MVFKVTGLVAAAALMSNVAMAADMDATMDMHMDSAAVAMDDMETSVAADTAMPTEDAMPAGAGEKLEDYMMDAKAEVAAETTVETTAVTETVTDVSTDVSVSTTTSAVEETATPVESAVTDLKASAYKEMEMPTPPEMDAVAPADAPAEDVLN